MTTPNNTPTRSAANAHEGRTAADTNPPKKFKVFFYLVQRSVGSTTVEAPSRHEARSAAKHVQLCDVDDWEVFEDKMTVHSVEPLSEGQPMTNGSDSSMDDPAPSITIMMPDED